MKKKILWIVFSAMASILLFFGLASCSGADKLIYDTPENILYDGQYITWDRVTSSLGLSADYYYVSIDGGEATRSNSTTYAYISDDTFEVTIGAVFDGDEKTSASVTFKPLESVNQIFVSDDGGLSWNAVPGANAYALSVNDEEISVPGAGYNGLVAGNNIVKVKPVVSGDNSYYSKWSEEVSVTIYNAPANVKYDGTELSWTGNALEYTITINGITQSVRGMRYAYNSENKDFTVEVKAIGNHTTTYDSKSVTEEFHYLEAVTDMIVEDGILKWTEVSGAESYKIKINSVEQKDVITATEYDKLTPGRSLDVSIMPVNTSGNYFSSWSAEKTFYVLEAPVLYWNNDLELDGEANNNLTWNAINSAAGYTVRLMKDGEIVKNESISAGQLFFAEAYAEVGVYTVQVKANSATGSGEYVDSKYSSIVTVERLAAPKAATQNFIVSDRDSIADGFTVNFVSVNGASGYQLYKDGVLLNGKYTTNSALTDSNVADESNILEQNYTYAVRSMGGVKTISGQLYVTLPCLTENALTFNILVQATPQNPKMSGYELSWDATSDNNGYTVSYAGTSMTALTERINLSTLRAGTYDITVSARGNGSNVLPSNASSPVAIERLEAPMNIRISADANGTLKWDDVSNARSYQVFLGLSSTALSENAYDNMYQFIETNGTTLTMVAVANYYNGNETLYYMTSENSPTQQFVRLAAPTFPEGALANSVELIWNAPSNINTSEYTPTYRIYSAIGIQIGGGDQNGTRFNIEYLEGGESYNFYIKAIGNETKYLDSDYSVVMTAYKLESPQFSLQNGKYVWKGVANASSYYLEIDGVKVSDEFHFSGNRYEYTPRFTTAGDHIVTLQAIGDGRNNLNSGVYKFVQTAKVLQSPTISYRYSDSTVVKNGSITIQIAEESVNCAGYQYEIAGESVTSTQLIYTKVIENTGKYAIRVKALGGTFDSDGIYYIDSQYAGGTSADVITLLGTPSTASFSINTDGVIKWGSNTDAFGYEYQISYNSTDQFGLVMQRSNNALDPIADFAKYRSITIRVRAKGSSDGKTVTSEWVTWTWTNPDYQG